jgi:hypothetical protein
VLNIIVANNMAPTTDEAWHVDYGVRILINKPDRSHARLDSKMPVSALNALPKAVSKILRTLELAPSLAAKLRDFRAARYPTIIAAFCLSLLVYVFTKSLYGHVAGVLAQSLFVISPNIIAHLQPATFMSPWSQYYSYIVSADSFCRQRY